MPLLQATNAVPLLSFRQRLSGVNIVADGSCRTVTLAVSFSETGHAGLVLPDTPVRSILKFPARLVGMLILAVVPVD